MGGFSFLKPDEKREIWANRVDEFKTSNLTQKSWCKEQGINYRNYVKDADKQIKVDNFCNNNRIKSIDTDKIII